MRQRIRNLAIDIIETNPFALFLRGLGYIMIVMPVSYELILWLTTKMSHLMGENYPSSYNPLLPENEFASTSFQWSLQIISANSVIFMGLILVITSYLLIVMQKLESALYWYCLRTKRQTRLYDARLARLEQERQTTQKV